METHTFDIVVIGAGIAGATAAAHLAADHKVALIEAEDAAGYHTTGRSAATWILNYGPPDIRVLTGLSRDFLANPPPGFASIPLLHHRPCVLLAPAGHEAELADAMADAIGAGAQGGGMRDLPIDTLRAMVPALRPDYATAAAIDDNAFDIDVAALHQGFLRQFAQRAGVLALRRVRQMERRDHHRRGVPCPGRGERGRRVGRRGRRTGGGRPARPGAAAAHRGDHRSSPVAAAGLAIPHRRGR
jgi:D-arginine dehydrogenase